MPPPDNARVAGVLETIGRILEIQGENTFKVRAYHNAARLIESLAQPVAELVDAGTLGELEGIGEALQAKITELVSTGRLEFYEKLRAEVPSGLLDILALPGIGPKSAKTMWHELGIRSITELWEACHHGKVARLKGFGERTQQRILKAIEFAKSHQGMYRIGDAAKVAYELIGHVTEASLAEHIIIAGSIRRGKEIVKNIDMLASTVARKALVDHFVAADGIVEIISRGEPKTSVRHASGIQVDLRIVEHEQMPFALQYFTGSKAHNMKLRSKGEELGLKMNEYGIFKDDHMLPMKSEHDIYELLGLEYIEPELREDLGEIEAASKAELPSLVALEDIQGVFHTHSTWSDGTAGIEEMAEKARTMGLKYIGLSDHSKAAAYANGLNEQRLREQWKEIDELNRHWDDFEILKGLECDILPDGSMDLNPNILSKLDFVIGSIHSRFDMSEDQMTARICRAIEDRNLHILGHPTGRLLLTREGYKVNLETVIAEARKNRKVIELNAHPHRLDLDSVHARRAAQQGVMVSINPDAHSARGIEDIRYGVGVARRAWLTRKDVLNTRPAGEALAILKNG